MKETWKHGFVETDEIRMHYVTQRGRKATASSSRLPRFLVCIYGDFKSPREPPKSVLAKFYTGKELLGLKRIYENANIRILK